MISSQQSFRIILFFIFILSLVIVNAQPPQRYMQVSVVPDHPDWTYKVGEKAKFFVSVTQSGSPVKVEETKFSVMPEKMEPVLNGPLKLENSKVTIEGGTMKSPGFLRCEVIVRVEGKEYKGIGTAAYEPEKIKPTVELPDDFNAFWKDARTELTSIPLDYTMTLLPDRCTETVNVYEVSFQNIKNSRIYGILCVPKGDGKYPAWLQVPGAGIRPYNGDIDKAKNGIITLQIGIHGIPVTLDPIVYQNLSSGPLNGYPGFNLDERDTYYYKRVYLGCVRAVDFLSSLPQYDGSNMVVSGGSQGGALSIVTAGLDERIKYLVAVYPALSDMTGYLHKRAGGWPHLLTGSNEKIHNKKDKIKTIAYYDVVNFARLIKVPGYYTWGYNDETCPPTSYYSAYNVITAPKQVFVVPETGHWTYPEQMEKANQWMMSNLGIK